MEHSYFMACEDIKQRLDGLNELKKETATDMKEPGLSAKAEADLLHQLKQIGIDIAATELALKQCLQNASAVPFLPPPTVPAQQRILEIQYTNPVFQPNP